MMAARLLLVWCLAAAASEVVAKRNLTQMPLVMLPSGAPKDVGSCLDGSPYVRYATWGAVSARASGPSNARSRVAAMRLPRASNSRRT